MQQQTPELRSRIILAELYQVQTATIEYLTERGFVIIRAQAGIINTDYKAASGMTFALLGEMRSKVNAILTRAGEGQTKILLTLVLEQKSGIAGWQTASVSASQSAKMYQTYLDEIAKRSLKKKF
jgi:hypothetical protein